MIKSVKSRVIIMGTTENVSVDICRSLIGYNSEIILACSSERRWMNNSNLFDTLQPLPRPDSKFRNWYDVIIRIGKNFRGSKENCFILASDDLDLKFLSLYESELRDYFSIIGTSSHYTLSNIIDKSYVYNNLNSVSKPETILFKGDIQIIDQINFSPILVKPSVRTEFNTFSEIYGKFRIFESLKELEFFLKSVGLKFGNLILQAYVQKSPQNEFSWIGYRDYNGKCKGISVCKTRQIPVGAGTTFAEVKKIEELQSVSKKILQELKFNGICEIEYIYDTKNKLYYFLEINVRPCRWFFLCIGYGFNIFEPFIKPTIINKNNLNNLSPKSRWMDLRFDFYYHVIQKNDMNNSFFIRLIRWLYFVRGSSFTYLDLSHPEIFYLEFKRLFKMLFNFIIKREKVKYSGEIDKKNAELIKLYDEQ